MNITAYLTRRKGYDGYDMITVPRVNKFGTVQKIEGYQLHFGNNVRTKLGKHTFGWIYTLRLVCGHTKNVWQRRFRCWTTHTRCGKCPRG